MYLEPTESMAETTIATATAKGAHYLVHGISVGYGADTYRDNVTECDSFVLKKLCMGFFDELYCACCVVIVSR